MRFIWDERKNAANIAKHGFSFERAMRVFSGPTLKQIDGRFDYGETRIKAVGLLEGVEITVIYVEIDEETYRIISARRSSRRERKAFQSGLKAFD
jgi:uncharacterized protein